VPHDAEPRKENLAICFQEVLTAIVRLRTNARTVTNAESFRAQANAAISAAEQASSRAGYLTDDARLATFAVVAFLDESVLNSRNPVFEHWGRRPVQEELFGVHVAGEIFFRNLERLLSKPDSHELADVLEVYQLCLRLGFRGRYGMTGTGEPRARADAIGARIKGIRGALTGLSPSWRPSGQAVVQKQRSPWTHRMTIGAAVCGVLAVLLFVVFKITLGSGLGDLK
jgi:type VI secretion system protein ImpK